MICKRCRGPVPANRICELVRCCMKCIENNAREAAKRIKYNLEALKEDGDIEEGVDYEF